MIVPAFASSHGGGALGGLLLWARAVGCLAAALALAIALGLLRSPAHD